MASQAPIRSHVAVTRVKATLFPLSTTVLLLILGPASWASHIHNYAVRFDDRGMPGGRLEQMPHREERWTASLVNWPAPRRWQISESEPPAGPRTLYRELVLWQRYRFYILAALGILITQLLLVWGLLIQARKRRAAESTLKDVSRYLIGTAEQERRRIARELHDDVNQKMALLSIELDRLQSDPAFSRPALKERLLRLLREANGISSDISRVSHELHSSALEFLGLAPALRRLCRDFSEHHDIRVAFTAPENAGDLSSELSLCFFRIAQECLTNVARHSGARSVDVQLTRDRVKGLQLTVVDDGRGFDASKLDEKGGLGIISMRERLRLVGGYLTLRTAPAEGTYLAACAPAPKQTAIKEETRPGLFADSMRAAKTRSRKVS